MPRKKPAARPLTADGRKHRPHWQLGDEARAADASARMYWAERTRLANIRKAGEAELREAETAALAGLHQLKKDGLDFVHSGDTKKNRPASAGPRLPTKKSFRHSLHAPVSAELIKLTPRGSEVVRRAEFNVNKLPSQSVNISVGLWIDSDEIQPQKDSRIQSWKTIMQDGPNPARQGRSRRMQAAHCGDTTSTSGLTKIDLTVLQGVEHNARMALTSGTVLRSSERKQDGEPVFERKGATQPPDPNRMSRSLYETLKAGGKGMPLRTQSLTVTDNTGEVLPEEDGQIDWEAGRDWMEDARPITPTRESEGSVVISGIRNRANQHALFNDTLLTDKDWGSNVTSNAVPYEPPRLPYKSPIAQLQRLARQRSQERARTGRSVDAKNMDSTASEAIVPTSTAVVSPTAATVAVEQLHVQLLQLNVSSQIKQQRARQPHQRKTRPVNEGTTDRNLWPLHARFGVRGTDSSMSNRPRRHISIATSTDSGRSVQKTGVETKPATVKNNCTRDRNFSSILSRPIGDDRRCGFWCETKHCSFGFPPAF
eukprot:SAG31_NODE_3917_length_3753_cov_2.846196_1_plen_541_part_00